MALSAEREIAQTVDFCCLSNFFVFRCFHQYGADERRGAEVISAQRAYALSRRGEFFFGISTSRNCASVIAVTKVTKTVGCTVIALTGTTGRAISDFVRILLNVFETDMYSVQEIHLPVCFFVCGSGEASVRVKE